jgi:hypothetical protein
MTRSLLTPLLASAMPETSLRERLRLNNRNPLARCLFGRLKPGTRALHPGEHGPGPSGAWWACSGDGRGVSNPPSRWHQPAHRAANGKGRRKGPARDPGNRSDGVGMPPLLHRHDYTITPAKVRSKKKPRGRKPAPAAAAAAAASNSAPAKAAARDGIALEDIRAVKQVVDRAGQVQQLAGMFVKEAGRVVPEDSPPPPQEGCFGSSGGPRPQGCPRRVRRTARLPARCRRSARSP